MVAGLRLSVLTAVHDKPLEVWEATLASLRQFHGAELVIVHDRAPAGLRAATEVVLEAVGHEAEVVILNLEGRPGWRSPCVSFNAGLERVTGDIVLVSHSDIIQDAGNADRIKAHFAEHPKSVLFGKVEESDPSRLEGAGNAGPLLMGTENPRPLTWSMAVPIAALKAIGGWDLAYMEGVCYEDDDLTARLWKSGLDFYFDDEFKAIHQTHSRAYFNPFRTTPNLTTFVNRYGCKSAGDFVRRSKPIVEIITGRIPWDPSSKRLVWKHA